MDLNEDLFRLINSLAGRWAGADLVGEFVGGPLVYVFGALVMGLCLWRMMRDDGHRRFGPLAETVLALVVALGVGVLLKHVVGESRPFLTQTNVHVLVPRPSDPSFPSNHAVAAGALAAAATLVWPRFWYGWAFAAAVIGLGRIYVGVHYPLDVIAGWLVGVFVAIAIHVSVSRAAKSPERGVPKPSKRPQEVGRT